jgi:hypothetical protein
VSWNEIRIEKWSDLLKEFDSLDTGQPSAVPYIFRGQSDANWALTDSLSRLLHALSPVSDPRLAEQLAYKKFLGEAHLFLDPSTLPAEKSLLAWWALMQHFGCPTRLMDWTASPYVATYFAVSENLEREGAVWAFDAATLVESDTRSGVKEFRNALDTSKDTWDVFWPPFRGTDV